jgi:hypothetical protein
MGQGTILAILQGSADVQDLMRKEYMGEVTIPLSQWFPTGEVQLWSDNLPVYLLPFEQGRADGSF